jgi:hypothetical protein
MVNDVLGMRDNKVSLARVAELSEDIGLSSVSSVRTHCCALIR